MINSPVLKLQEMASSSKTDIAELLSKAKMISVKLGLSDISEWIEYELNGYPSNEVLPSYRVLKDVPIRAFNPYRGWVPCQLSGKYSPGSEMHDALTTAYIPNSISMVIEYTKMDNILFGDLPGPFAEFIQKATGTKFRMAWCFNQAQMVNVLSSVKSKILDWALLLESKNILGEGLQFSREEKNEAIEMTVNNNNTNNFHGSVNNSGSISSGTTGDINQQNTIMIGDFQSLERKLSEYGIANSDISKLKEIIESSPKPASADELGKGVGGWIGNMISKAYSGSLKIAASAAPALLTNALCHYYGIPV